MKNKHSYLSEINIIISSVLISLDLILLLVSINEKKPICLIINFGLDRRFTNLLAIVNTVRIIVNSSLFAKATI